LHSNAFVTGADYHQTIIAFGWNLVQLISMVIRNEDILPSWLNAVVDSALFGNLVAWYSILMYSYRNSGSPDNLHQIEYAGGILAA
jgi:hypothetical protein